MERREIEELKKKLEKCGTLSSEERTHLIKLVSEEEIQELVKETHYKDMYLLAVKNADLKAELAIEKAKSEHNIEKLKTDKNKVVLLSFIRWLGIIVVLSIASIFCRHCFMAEEKQGTPVHSESNVSITDKNTTEKLCQSKRTDQK